MANFQGFNFGEIVLEGWLQGRKSAEQRAQFEMEQNRIARQEGLMNMFREDQARRGWERLAIEDRKPIGVSERGYYDPQTMKWVPNPDYQNLPMTEYQKTEAQLRARGYDIEEKKLADKATSGGLTPYEQYNIRQKQQQAKAEYENIMGSQWMSNEELNAMSAKIPYPTSTTEMGISKPLDKTKWGGGFYVDNKFFASKDQLERYARAASGYTGKATEKAKPKIEY